MFIQRKNTRIVIVTAPKCGGKSTTTRQIAEERNIQHLESDTDITNRFKDKFGLQNEKIKIVMPEMLANPKEVVRLHQEWFETRGHAEMLLVDGYCYLAKRFRICLYAAAKIVFDEPNMVLLEMVPKQDEMRLGLLGRKPHFSDETQIVQQAKAQKRLVKWGKTFEPPDEREWEESAVRGDYQQVLGWESARARIIDLLS